MAPTSEQGLLMVGYGPGIGAAVTAQFVTKGFNKIAIVSRSKRDPKEVAKSWSTPDVDVQTWAVDITNTEEYVKVLASIEAFLGNLTCVVYNAARVAPSELLTFPIEEIRKDFEINNIALYVTARWATPILQAKSKAEQLSFLITNSHLPEEPIPQIFSLSMAKASQANMTKSLAQSFPSVHFALVNVRGVVTPGEKNLNPTNIAEKFWELYSQPKNAWTVEINIYQ